jgi:hypothetical protein
MTIESTKHLFNFVGFVAVEQGNVNNGIAYRIKKHGDR